MVNSNVNSNEQLPTFRGTEDDSNCNSTSDLKKDTPVVTVIKKSQIKPKINKQASKLFVPTLTKKAITSTNSSNNDFFMSPKVKEQPTEKTLFGSVKRQSAEQMSSASPDCGPKDPSMLRTAEFATKFIISPQKNLPQIVEIADPLPG